MLKPSIRRIAFYNKLFASLASSFFIGLALTFLGVVPVFAAPPIEPPLFQYTPPRAAAPATSSNTSSIPPVLSSINILILALDEADINAARITNIAPLLHTAPDAGPRAIAPGPAPPPLPAAPPRNDIVFALDPRLEGDDVMPAAPAIPPLPAMPGLGAWEETPLEPLSQRPPGRAQFVAAPLRRALTAAGLRDVLTTPLDGASVLRSLNSGRLTMRTLDALRFTTGQILDAAKAGAERFTAQDGVMEKLPTATSPSPALAQARETAISAASRIGLTLGYRAVVVLSVAPDARADHRGAVYSLLIVDAPRETGQAFLLRQDGDDQTAIDQTAAGSTAQNIVAQLRDWPPFTGSDRAAQVEKYLAAARASLEKNDLALAQDQLQLVVAFDPSNTEAYVLLGDALQAANPASAARAYQRAAEINTQNGEVWAKMAIVHTLANPPDWIRSLQSAKRAQQLGYDSANLRTAMAASEFGRAESFRRNGRIEQAEDAELLARRHLERARELAPDDPEVAAGVSRLMAKYLLDQKRYKEAVQALDLLAIQYPNDVQTQTMYARALEGYGKRDEDTFLAWARVWKLNGEGEVLLSAQRYAVIADGFDQRLVSIGQNIFQLSYGVSTGAILRETAILQTRRAKEELKTVVAALRIMRPPAGKTTSEAHVNRLFAADLMQQAMEYYAIYLETGDDLNRTRGIETHRQAIESLNNARTSGNGNAMDNGF